MPVRGVLPVIPTPLRDGEFDPTSFQRLLDHMLESVDGYTLLGSTGEAPSLTLEQRLSITEQALRMTPTEKNVIVGVSHTSVADSITLARHAQDNGAHAVLCSSPYYFANQPDGILRFLAQVDAVLDVELVLYDNPDATKTTLRPDWIVHWASQLSRLNSVKLTDHDVDKIAAWQQAGLSVLAGDDSILFQYLTAGVDGAMVIAPAVLPASFRAVWDHVQAKDLTAALDRFSREIAPFLHVFGIGAEVATTKAVLQSIGVFESAEVLAPLIASDAARTALLHQAWQIGSAAAGSAAAAE